jgi:hypothetical protein
MLFTFDNDFSEEQRKPAAERVLAARARGKNAKVIVPEGMYVHVRQRADLPWHPIEPVRGRGQPPKTPAGTWEDDDLPDTVEAILGDPDDRADRGTEIREALCRVARDALGPERFTVEREDVLKLARKAIAGKIASLEIVRQLRVWQHDLTDPAVRRMQSRKTARPRVKMKFG